MLALHTDAQAAGKMSRHPVAASLTASAAAVVIQGSAAVLSIGPARPKSDFILVPRSQAYYWTPSWQAGEAEADADIAAGRIARFAFGLGWRGGEDEAYRNGQNGRDRKAIRTVPLSWHCSRKLRESAGPSKIPVPVTPIRAVFEPREPPIDSRGRG